MVVIASSNYYRLIEGSRTDYSSYPAKLLSSGNVNVRDTAGCTVELACRTFIIGKALLARTFVWSDIYYAASALLAWGWQVILSGGRRDPVSRG